MDGAIVEGRRLRIESVPAGQAAPDLHEGAGIVIAEHEIARYFFAAEADARVQGDEPVAQAGELAADVGRFDAFVARGAPSRYAAALRASSEA